MTTDLIKRLTEAREGSRELDVAVREAMGYSDAGEPPHYTTSLDAAMTLVPEGWDSLRFERGRRGFGCFLGALDTFAATKELALCISALKAKDQS